MKFYIATALQNWEAHNKVRDSLVAAGHEITYDWTLIGPAWHLGTRVLGEISEAEIQGVVEADILVMLLPGGRGTHAELGAALATKKEVFLYSEDDKTFLATPETSSFYHHSYVYHFCNLKELVDSILHTPERGRDG